MYSRRMKSLKPCAQIQRYILSEDHVDFSRLIEYQKRVFEKLLVSIEWMVERYHYFIYIYILPPLSQNAIFKKSNKVFLSFSAVAEVATGNARFFFV